MQDPYPYERTEMLANFEDRYQQRKIEDPDLQRRQKIQKVERYRNVKNPISLNEKR